MKGIRFARVWIQAVQWTMGNGQCPECAGLCPQMEWGAGRDENKGHRKGCGLAVVMEELGMSPEYAKQDPYERNNKIMSGARK